MVRIGGICPCKKRGKNRDWGAGGRCDHFFLTVGAVGDVHSAIFQDVVSLRLKKQSPSPIVHKLTELVTQEEAGVKMQIAATDLTL